MPWVNEDLCVGCGVCVDECPAGAIRLNDNHKAIINEDECIRCGRCHDVCPEEAVRHDSERIPQEVEANVERTKDLLKHFETLQEQQAFLERMVRYFKKQQKVASLTIDRITSIKANLASR
ncbi:MAG TPA: 4Fe-4S dicluster domain-containing protein [Thermodesulforhabdus norvegica]|uniref:4Fe-4S dicluster domain-containing protein n=1 Tax=Thermodesulforhabdus norvegica TaxID=39841 RepID=A0A7C0WU03_9BACT|nr:4Fe-4S dicluster domain-containing protein [Thermodesulforhabdus norvegica]